MPVVRLGEQYRIYIGGCATVCQNEEEYKPCKLFKKCINTLKRATRNSIYLYDKSKWPFEFVALTRTDRYLSACLERVEVFFNRYDDNKTALLFVLAFKNLGDGHNGVQNRYYRMSCFCPDTKRGCKNKPISGLCQYDGDDSMLCPLLEENDALNDVLTYDIMRKKENGGHGRANWASCTYNCGKIEVKDVTNSGSPKLGNGFRRYKHTPAGGNGHGDKKACVVYRCQALVGSAVGAECSELAGIQGLQYACVKVYFGTKARRQGHGAGASSGTACRPGSSPCTPAPGAGDTCKPDPGTCPAPASEGNPACSQDVPLLLELLRNGSREPDYYVHRRNCKGYYWVKMLCENGDNCQLKALMEDIGLPTTENGDCQAGYLPLKKLLSAAPTDGGPAYEVDCQSEEDISREIVVLNTNGQNGAKTMLTLLLKRVEFDITDSLVILLDQCECKTGPTNGGYEEEQIKLALSGMDPRDRGQRINAQKINNGAKITVKCATCSNGDGPCKCLKQYGYCLVVHDFCKPVEKLGDKCSVGLRFFIPTENGNGLRSNGENGTKYRELSLYAGTDKTGPAGLEYLYYTRGDNGASCQNGCAAVPPSGGQTCSGGPGASDCAKVFVVFYRGGCPCPGGCDCASGCKGDPRPLMLCCNGCWYRPKDKTSYFSQWVKVDGLTDKSACACPTERGGGTSCSDTRSCEQCPKCDKLLLELTKVVGFLNTVQLRMHPGSTGEAASALCQQSEVAEGGQGDCSAGARDAGTSCQAGAPSGNGSECKNASNGPKCTYTVHTYNGSDVKVQVECCPVSNGTSGGQNCYKRLTHTPIGACNGGDGPSATNGFRLGNIVYCGNGCNGDKDGKTCRIDYYGANNGSQVNGNVSDTNKYNPLLCVSAYFYDEDKEYCDPLLVELTFKNVKCNGVADGLQNGTKEYYRLTCDNPGGLEWTKVDNGCKAGLENPECLTRYLDQIRYCLKLTLRVHLECKGTNGAQGAGNGYPLMGRKAANGGGQFSDPIKNGYTANNGNGKVKVCESKCENLTKGKYACFRHCLTSALANKHHKVAGLVFTLPCQPNGGAAKNGTCCVNAGNGVGTSGTNGFVEIPVCIVGEGECREGTKTGCPPVTPAEGLCAAPAAATQDSCPADTQNGFTIPPILYNKCMGDVYVYFYACKSGGTEACTVGTGTAGTSSSSSSCSPKNGGNDQTDTVPLMVRFNSRFYKPCSRDFYFTRWVCIPGLCKKPGECKCPCCCGAVVCDATGSGCTSGGAGCTDVANCVPDCTCCKELAKELDKVNADLNRIDLDPCKARLVNGSCSSSGSSNGKGYGLPEKNGCSQTQTTIRGCKLATSVGNYRICLTKQEPKNGADKAYTRIVHRTTNGFKIGCITYCGHEIVASGITPIAKNGAECNQSGSSPDGTCPSTSGLGAAQTCTINTGDGDTCPAAVSPSNGQNCTIRVSSGGHTKLVSEVNANTVVVYYLCTDTCKALPQLIVILHTAEVKNGHAVTAGNGNKKYGYYLLSNGGRGIDGHRFEYKWVDVNGTEGGTGKAGVTLDDPTDFKLLNSAVILLHCRVRSGAAVSCCSYGENQICQAVKSAIQQNPDLKSPGNTSDVNRLQYRTITVTDESEKGTCASADASTSPGTCCCKCLIDAGFKVMTHDLCPLVKLNGFKEPLCNVRLITGLKLLIPTAESGQYKQLTLNGSQAGGANGANNVKYHHPNKNKICVYFYGSDPRPLLVSYNGWAYRANSKDEYDKQEWAECKEAAKCGCTQAPGTCQCTQEQGKCDQCPLLKALVCVSDFLNPVDIKLVPRCPQTCRCYPVHRFNGCRIWIRVTAKRACGSFCYHQYNHGHAGLGGDGTGFRLGTLHYGNGTGKNGVANGTNTCIKSTNGTSNNGVTNGCINSVITNGSKSSGGKPCETASHVVAFYYKLDSEHKTPIVVALCSNGSGGTCASLTCKLYYVLKSREGKTYTKGENGLDMDKDDELSKQLDDALFKNTKKLQIVLSTRPVESEYKAEQDKKCEKDKPEESSSQGAYVMDYHENVKKMAGLRSCKANLLQQLSKDQENDPKILRDALMHHVQGSTEYKAQLCDKNGGSASSSSPLSTNQIDVKVQEVTCDKSYSDGGYRCFKHGLTTASGISEVGGLKLCLWVTDGVAKGANGQCAPCTEGGKGSGQEGITLCNGSAGTKNGSTKVELTYTTCKGDLYVFFYDEDPRPLLLCYNGEAYYPKTMEEYCSKWVKVGNGSTKCVVNGNVVQANESILKALFEVSMFLNPVYLVLCNTDYQKLDPPHNQEQHDQAQQSNTANGHQQSDQDKHHSYAIHRESRPPICIKVTGRDLRCYREYVHRPERQGFRLGYVTYTRIPGEAGTLGARTTCSPSSTTDSSSSCQSTASTPATSSCQSTPTTTPTTTSTASNGFCFYYDCKKQLQTVSLYYYMYDKCHNWPLVVMLSYKGQSSEFFRLCCPGVTAGGTDDTSSGGTCQSGSGVAGGDNSNGQKCSGKKVDPGCLKWVKMGPESGGKDSCGNGSGSVGGNGNNQDQCAPCPANSGASGTSGAADSALVESAEMCQEDAEFVERAQEIHDAIYSAQSPLSVFTEDRLPLTRELSDLIEGRAYQVRKGLGIQYSDDSHCLILATASHCWEEWPLAYIVGGSALSVAAGGSWKFVVMAVGVFVKL